MKEIIIYLLSAISSLIVAGYAIHMIVGDLVSKDAEHWLITAACVIVSGVIGYMARDVVVQRRSGKK